MFILSNYAFLGKDFHFLWKITIFGEKAFLPSLTLNFVKKNWTKFVSYVKKASEISEQ